MQATFDNAAPSANKDLKDTMKDEVNRIAENKERAQKGEPQIPGAAVREGAADISPSAHDSAERAKNNAPDANAPSQPPLV